MADTKISLCSSCAAAFRVGVTDESSNNGREDVATAEPPSKRPKLGKEGDDRICQHCLGLLDELYQKEIVESVREKLEAENYVAVTTFHLCIHVSPALAMQNHIVKQCIHKATSTITTALPSEDFVKEQLKLSLFKSTENALRPLKADINSKFLITLNFQHDEADRTCEKFIAGTVKQLKKMKQKGQSSILSIRLVQTAMESSNYGHLSRIGLLPHQVSYHTPCSHTTEFLHESVFLAGRYNKYSRTLSQTPWFVDGKRKAEFSVQDFIVRPLQEAFRSNSTTFSSSGREDVDVRMLGSGRPFMVEITNPHDLCAIACCRDLEDVINHSTLSIAVSKLQPVDRRHGSMLKDGEENRKKRYSALIWSSTEIMPNNLSHLNSIINLVVAQKTPLRVLHRRSAATRNRTVASLRAEYLDNHHFKLDLVTQSGTYIKEFVHGDLGRTVPNLCTIMGHDVDILALDVTDIDLVWPPTPT